VACPAVQYFPTLSVPTGLKHYNFQEEMGKILSKLCDGLYVMWPSFLSGFNETHISYTFSKNTHISISMLIHPVAADLVHAVGPTDGHDDANSRFSQFRLRA
jgi:hypothetical protein